MRGEKITQKTAIGLTTYNKNFSYAKNLRSKGVDSTGCNGPLCVTKAFTDNKNPYLQR